MRRTRSTPTSGPAAHPTRRTRAVVGLVASTVLPAMALLAWTPSTARAATAPGADVSALLAVGALLLAWLVVARLTVTLLAVLVAVLPGAVGAAAGRVADAVTPRLLRSVVRVACGAAVAGAPIVGAGSALADPVTAPTRPAPVTSSGVRLVDPAQLPLLDRVAVEPTRAARPVPAGAAGLVVVRSGDTLWRIADRAARPGAH